MVAKMFRRTKSEAVLQDNATLKRSNSLKELMNKSPAPKVRRSSSVTNLLRRSSLRKSNKDEKPVETVELFDSPKKSKKGRRLSGKALSKSLRNLFSTSKSKLNNKEEPVPLVEVSPATPNRTVPAAFEDSTRTADMTDSFETRSGGSDSGGSVTETCLTVTPERPIMLETPEEVDEKVEVEGPIEEAPQDDELSREEQQDLQEEATREELETTQEEEEEAPEEEKKEETVDGYALVPSPPTIPRDALLDGTFEDFMTLDGKPADEVDVDEVEAQMASDDESVVQDDDELAQVEETDAEPVVEEEEDEQELDQLPTEDSAAPEPETEEFDLSVASILDDMSIESIKEEADEEEPEAQAVEAVVATEAEALISEETFSAGSTRDSIVLAKVLVKSDPPAESSFSVVTVLLALVVLGVVTAVVAHQVDLLALNIVELEMPSLDLEMPAMISNMEMPSMPSLDLEMPAMISNMELPSMPSLDLEMPAMISNMEMPSMPSLDLEMPAMISNMEMPSFDLSALDAHKENVSAFLDMAQAEVEGYGRIVSAYLNGAANNEEAAEKVARQVIPAVLNPALMREACKGAYCGFA